MRRAERSEDVKKFFHKFTVLTIYVLIALCLIASAFYQFRKVFFENVQSISQIYLQEYSDLKAFHIDKGLDAQFSVVQKSEAAIRAASSRHQGVQDIPSLQKYLSQVQSIYNIDFLALRDNTGKYCSTTKFENLAIETPVSRSLNTPIRGHKRMITSYTDLASGEDTVFLELPIDNLQFGEYKFISVMMGVNKTEFTNEIGLHDTNLQICNTLINTDGTIPAYTDPNSILQGDNNFFTLLKTNTDINAKHSLEILKNDFATGKSGMINYKQRELYTFLSYAPVEGTDCYLLSEMPYNVINSSIEDFMNAAALVGMVIVFVVITLLAIFLYSSYQAEIEKKRVNDINETLRQTGLAKQQAEDAMTRMAFYDELTGIPNKNMFRNSVHVLLLQPVKYAYVILDIRKFKVVNDLFGYSRGDILLKHIALVLQESIEPDETVARFSSDIFHILLRYQNKFTLEERLRNISDEICSFSFAANTTFHITLGFGVYVIENISDPIDQMGDRASLALNKIKDLHTTAIFFYNEDIRNTIMEEQEIEADMQQAVDREEFVVYFQPQYEASTGKIAGGEALVRWQHPKRGLIAPDLFIPLFEKNGFICTLDIYVLETVCKKIRQWIDEGYPMIPISINQSRLLLYSAGYTDALVQLITKYQIPHNLIELEITESVFLEDNQKMISIMQSLHELEFSISMDDFGSGYSTLNMLKEIMVDTLKIDKDFFSISTDTKRGRTIVSNIITMARELNISVIAEGVETLEQVDFLRESGCDLLQGFYYSRPIPASDFQDLLKDQKTKD